MAMFTVSSFSAVTHDAENDISAIRLCQLRKNLGVLTMIAA